MSKKALSANTLFHFTKSLDNIESILKRGFAPRYCMENFDFIFNEDNELNFNNQFAIPMVCFCDIPLSQISSHINAYGGYAIGLSKEWGERNSINPVMYELSNSYPIKLLIRNMKTVMKYLVNHDEEMSTKIELDELLKKDINDIGLDLFRFMWFLKPYEGNNWNEDEFDGDLIRFYDEREWRYIPHIDKSLKEQYGLKRYLSKATFNNRTQRQMYNNLLEDCFHLSFEPNDIKYIIVNNEDEIVPLMSKIENIKGRHFTHDDIRKLMSRIISKEQILEDF